MTDVIGRGVIEVVADSTKLKAGISDAKTSLQTLREAAKGVGESLNNQSITYIRSLERQSAALERQAANFGKSKSEIAAYNAQQQGVSNTAAGFVERIRSAEKSLRDQAAAAKEAGAAVGGLAEKQRFLDTLATKARPVANPFEAAGQQGAALGIDAARLDPLIAKWRAVEKAALEAAIAEKTASEASAFLGSLQGRIQGFGKGSAELLELKAAQLGATQTAGPLIAQLRTLETQATQTAAAERQAAEATNFLKSLQTQVSSIGKTSAELVQLKAAQLGVSDKAAPLIAALAAEEKGLGKVGAGSKLAAFQTQQLGFQLHDFTVQVLSGQSPLIAFVQQGSQLSGTFGGAGNAFKAVLGLLTPMRVVLGGVAGAAAALGFAFYEGSRQSQAFAQALTLTGNFAGQTEGQFNALTKAVAKSTGETVGNVRELGQALLSTGEIGPQVFAAATQAAVGYGQATGKTAEEVAKDFAAMARSPAKFAAEANRQLNFITAAQYAAIKAFEDNGRAADAQGIIYDALNARFPTINQNLGTLERVLNIGKSAWSSFWNSAFDVGRAETLEQKIARTAEKLRAAQPPATVESAGGAAFVAPRSGRRSSSVAAELAALQAEQTENLRDQFFASQHAGDTARGREIQKAGIAAQDFGRKALEAAKDVGALNRELAENKRQFKAAADANTPFTTAQQKAIDDATRKKFAGPKGGGRTRVDNEPEQVRRALLDADLKFLQDKLAEERDAISFHSRELQALYQAGNVSLREFYDGRNREITQGIQRELNALTDEQARLEVELQSPLVKANPSEQIRIETQLSESVAKSAKIRTEGARAVRLSNLDEVASFKQLADQVTNYRANLLQLQGDEIGASRLRAQQAIEQAQALAKQSGGQISQAEIAAQKTALDGQIALQAAQTRSSQINERLAIQEERIALMQKTGTIGELAALQATGEARSKLVAQLEEQLAIQERIAATRPNDEALATSVERTRLELDKLKASLDPLAEKFDSLFRDSASSAIADFLNGTKSAKDALRGFGRSILNEINAISSREIARSLFGKDGLVGIGSFLSGKQKSPVGETVGDSTAILKDTTASASIAFADLRATGITPTIDALFRLQQAADTAAGSIGKPIIETTGDFARFDRRNDTGEKSITDLFKDAEASQSEASKSAEDFGRTASSAAGEIGRLAIAANSGQGALSLLPSIISSIANAASGTSSGGGLLGTIASLAASYYSGGSYSANAGVGYSNAAGISGGRAGGGPVSPGRTYEVNERGRPELLEVAGKQYLMMGTQGGNVTPTTAPSRQINVTNVFHLDQPASRATQAQVATQAGRGIDRALARGDA